MKTTRDKALLLALGLGGGVLPVLVYGLVFGRWPSPRVEALQPLPHCAMSLAGQWLAVLTAFALKPVYMVLCLVLIVWLWRQAETDLAALRWGLVWFWLGENACSVNFVFCHDRSTLMEYLHSYGMTVGFALVVYAVLEGLDQRLLKLSPPGQRCAALNLCRACIKYAAVPCGLQQLFVWMIPAFMALALIPLTAGVKLAAYRTTILGSAYQYGHPAVYQWFEIRYCPGLALVLLAASWLVLVGQRRDPVPPAKRLFAAALGLLGFSLARLGLFAIYPDRLVWFVFWEEFTEFLLIFSIAAVLWVFRRTLFAHPSPASAPGASVATAAPAEAA